LDANEDEIVLTSYKKYYQELQFGALAAFAESSSLVRD
jgi:hypothetical protein